MGLQQADVWLMARWKPYLDSLQKENRIFIVFIDTLMGALQIHFLVSW